MSASRGSASLPTMHPVQQCHPHVLVQRAPEEDAKPGRGDAAVSPPPSPAGSWCRRISRCRPAGLGPGAGPGAGRGLRARARPRRSGNALPIARAGDVSEAVREWAAEELEDCAGQARAQGLPGPGSAAHRVVHREIVALAREVEADLIVVATLGRDGIGRALLGSVGSRRAPGALRGAHGARAADGPECSGGGR